MTQFKRIHVEYIDDVAVIHLGESELMGKDANVELRNELMQCLKEAGSRKVVVSLQRVRRLTSETINSLLRARDHVVASDGEISLSDVREDIREVLSLLKLDGRVFQVFDSTDAALQSLNKK